ncbi:beta-ketoacyl-ACP synthase III [Millisia brevis]|uniref:beta-ketoacyl-ACP synthase III n=1 Tax=Millisia brevis TaxID=264148 RepID=UPI000832D028|nr:beta-ketoacyl-ACP synthase III [Millisia brevis]
MRRDTGRAAVLTGLGGYVPETVVSNREISSLLDTSDEWIFSRTGIRERRVADADTSTGDLAVRAGARALEAAGGGGVDLIVLATTTPDYPCPATAPWVADALGLGPIPAYDVAAVCSGFVYALGIASAHIMSGQFERVLVIGADKFSSILDPSDRTTMPIFGDGAGAAVLEAGSIGSPGALLAVDLGSDGGNRRLISVPSGGSRRSPATSSRYFTMDGKATYKQAIAHMTGSSRQVIARAGWTVEDVDWVVGHQANIRILQGVADEMSISRDKLVSNIDVVGNTSAASIPLAMCHGAVDAFGSGDLLVLTAFGGGLTWGSIALTWPKMAASYLSHTNREVA